MPRRIGSDPNARAAADAILRRVAPDARDKAQKALEAAAGADGNRDLSVAEAKLVADAFDAASPQPGALLGADAVDRAAGSLATEVARRLAAANLDGVTANFNSDGTSLEAKVIEAMRGAEASAKGKRLDLDIMIFQFQSAPIAAELVRIARDNPDAHIHIVADWSQLTEGGTNQPPLLEKKARELGLKNIDVRYKKDDPYAWDDRAKKPSYDHAKTRGLLHRKGFVALVDGVPVKMAAGSFNWSKTADKANYEDLVVVDPRNEATEGVALAYEREFSAFFNSADALTGGQARAFKRDVQNRMRREHGLAPFANLSPGTAPARYESLGRSAFDVNSLSTDDAGRIDALCGKTLASKIRGELKAGGRFASYDDLAARVPGVARLAGEARAALGAAAYGEGKVGINVADAAELARAGMSAALAAAVVDYRTRHGDFESLDDLAKVPGMTGRKLAQLRPRLTDDAASAFFTARTFDGTAPWRGYDPANAGRTVAMPGEAELVPASVTNAAVDLLRRARPGDTVRIAMYGFQANAPEYREMMAANDRGVKVKLILNEGYNDPVVSALKSALAAGRTGLEVRIQTAKTLHEKFMVVNDDLFTGSANFSVSANERHTEDRYVLRNSAELSARYTEEFERVFARSKDIAAT